MMLRYVVSPPKSYDSTNLYCIILYKQVKTPISTQIKAILMWNWSPASYPLHLVKINKQESLSLHSKTFRNSHLIVESKHKLWIQISSLTSSINFSEVLSTLSFLNHIYVQNKYYINSASALLAVFDGRVNNLKIWLLEEKIPDGWETRIRHRVGLTFMEFNLTVLGIEFGIGKQGKREREDVATCWCSLVDLLSWEGNQRSVVKYSVLNIGIHQIVFDASVAWIWFICEEIQNLPRQRMTSARSMILVSDDVRKLGTRNMSGAQLDFLGLG